MAGRLATATLAILLVAGLALVMTASFQSSLLFPVGSVASAPMPADARPIDTIAADGRSNLYGLAFAPSQESPDSALVLGFGGNGWNAIHAAELLRQLFPRDHVTVFFYRGYPPSQGDPSSAALVADAPLAYDAAVRASGARRVILAGFSIGSGIAATLATTRRVDGLILVTPFDRLKKVAADHYPFLPVALLFRHDIDAAEALRAVRVPVAIIAAGKDEIIPAKRTAALRDAVGTLVVDRTITGAGHNDIYGHPAFAAAMREARDRVLEKPEAP